MKRRQLLHENWVLKMACNNGAELPDTFDLPDKGIAATIPGTVHTDLLNAGLIPEPFASDNETDLKWISTCDWLYETRFDYPATDDKNLTLYLVFEGIDTYAQISLNGKVLATVDNMFLRHTFRIDQMIRQGTNNLSILFYSPFQYTAMNERPLRQFSSARFPERVFIRKAQYSFGWDWGPSFPTMGLWRPVYLEWRDKAVIRSFYFETTSLRDDRAEVRIKTEVEDSAEESYRVEAVFEGDGQRFSKENPSDEEFRLIIERPKLWWPQGYGEPFLYDLQLKLKDSSGRELDILQTKVGLRTVKLELQTGQGKAFRFRINGKLLYLKGANWIPADSFLPRVTPDKYRYLLNMAQQANMNILRVWGGGIYEDDLFYRLCDEQGILVWQDFMFACAAYPENEEFLANVQKEIEYNVKRLQAHPSVLIWCGNNENEWIWYRDTYEPMTDMPGYNLFHQIIPQWLQTLDPTRPYWPSSPFGDEEDPNDPASGNRHQWDIWSHWVDYSEVIHDRSLFVTEFGFQGPADYYTFAKYLKEDELQPQSRVFEFHNKQEEGPERIYRFLSGHLPVKEDIHSYIYLAQMNQAFALKHCLEHWRLRRPETAGSIIWQINDCWPVTSWSLIDSELIPKPAYYEVRRVFADVLLAFKNSNGLIELFLDRSSAFSGLLKLHKVNTPDGKTELIETSQIRIAEDESFPQKVFSLSPQEINRRDIFVASLYDEQGKLIARNYAVSSRWKYYHLPYDASEPQIHLDVDAHIISLATSIPLFFVILRHPQARFSDSGFIILPGEKIDVIFEGKIESENEVEIRFLNQYLTRKSF